ncbi:unnamed protein product [Peronospora destructor]|uniref:Uncharacterized protein n=1 Tax=Peronospora destructor TaxID=86335 RepID=A0AAV0UAT5_9STRA|nr:unnamed protein product [Peronospora destructor]
MAHVGSTYEYCQVISAHSQEQEQLTATFPLSEQPFERLELTQTERRHFHTQATELLGYALKEYDEFVLIRHRQVDRLRWKLVKNHENMSVYRESRSYVFWFWRLRFWRFRFRRFRLLAGTSSDGAGTSYGMGPDS